jgi:hypothetical protein
MAYPEIITTFADGSGNLILAKEINDNFTSIITGVSDGNKDLNVYNITANGTTTAKGNLVIDSSVSIGPVTSIEKLLSVSTGSTGHQAIFGQGVTTGSVGIVIGPHDAAEASVNIVYDIDNTMAGMQLGGVSLGESVNFYPSGRVAIGGLLPSDTIADEHLGITGNVYVNGGTTVTGDSSVAGDVITNSIIGNSGTLSIEGTDYILLRSAGVDRWRMYPTDLCPTDATTTIGYNNKPLTIYAVNVGSSGTPITDIYATTLHTGDVSSSGELTITSGGSLSFYTAGSERWYVGANGVLLPKTDSLYSIGADTQRVKYVYADGAATGGTEVLMQKSYTHLLSIPEAAAGEANWTASPTYTMAKVRGVSHITVNSSGGGASDGTILLDSSNNIQFLFAAASYDASNIVSVLLTEAV